MRRVHSDSTGPLVTNHIRNLDQELEMLQRRRELLQHEQQRLNNEQMFHRKRQYETDHLPHNFPYAQHQTSSQSYAHLYDDGAEPSYINYGPTQSIKKRHTINVWDDDRFNMSPNPMAPPRFGPFADPNPPRMSPPIPLMSITTRPSIGRRIAGPTNPRNRKDFTPNKVTKPKAKPKIAANLNPALVPPKKKGIQSALNKNPNAFMLLPDQVPSQQVTGRLELALGAILKEMKEHYCTNEEKTSLFNSKHVQRSIKQSIRERLRIVMLNKVVGRFVEIVSTYRSAYPATTDKEILDNAIINSDSENLIQPYFNKILSKKLNDLFVRLQLLSEGKDMVVKKIIESRPCLTEENLDDIKKRNADAKTFYTSLVDALLEDRIPKILPNFAEHIIQIFLHNKQYDAINNVTINEQDEEHMIKNDPEIEQGEGLEILTNDTDKGKSNNHVEIKEKSPIVPFDQISNGEIPKIEEKSKDYVQESLMNENVKEDKSSPMEVIDDSKTDNSVGTTVQKNKTGAPPHHFVKVLGQPSLPNRSDAYKFLNQFNAVSIKKHKVIQNLLVVGFNTEKDFNDAIAASGSVIGNSNLIIKANDKPSQNTLLPFKENKTDGDIIPQDLDNQISDLLSSIRNADDAFDKSEKSETQVNTIRNIKVENASYDSVPDSATNEELVSKNKDPNIKLEVIEESESLNIEPKLESESEEIESKNNMYSPSPPCNDARVLETLKEEVDEKICIIASENEILHSNGDKNVKSNVKDTPSKPSRQSVATPRTLRTRSSSRLMQNN